MMNGLRGWLMAMIAVCVLCALADSLMAEGAVKRVGRLVCGMALVCVVLAPLARLDFEGGQGWLEEYFLRLETQKTQLGQQVDYGMKPIIEERFAAYILDKAEEMGLSCTVQVSCRADENGLYVPDQVQLTGICSDVEQSQMTQMIQEQLDVPPQRQIYYIEEELP